MTKRHQIFLSITLSAIGLFAVVLGGQNINGSFFATPARSLTNSYSLTLKESNQYHNGETTKQITTDSGNYKVEFAYYNCSSLSGGHVTINNEGTVKNVDHILSIESITPVFTCSSSASLKFRASYDAKKWGEYATLTSGKEFSLSSNPYYIELKAFGGSVDLTSLQISYACSENEEGDKQTGEVWQIITSENDIEYNKQYVIASLEENYALSKTQNSNGYREGVAITKNSNGTLNINNSVEILTLVSGYTSTSYSTTYAFKTSANKYLNADSNDRLTTKDSLGWYSTFGVGLWTVNDYDDPSDFVPGDAKVQCLSNNNNSYLIYDSTDHKFSCYKPQNDYVQGESIALYKKVIIDSIIPSYSTGIKAVDQSANSYKIGDIFGNKVGTSSGMIVSLEKSDGSSITLNKDDYSYTLKTLGGTIISPDTAFASSGSYIVTISYGNFTFSYQINVAINSVESITLDRTSLKLEPTGTATLSATVSPSNATNKNVLWESDNDAVATVNNGVVTAVSDGDATIIAKSESNPTVTATCSVKVRTPGSASNEYTLVTSDTELVDGDYYIIAYVSDSTKVTAAPIQSGKVFLDVDSTSVFEEDNTIISEVGNSTIEFKLAADGNNWKFDYNGSYLGATDAKKLAFGSGTFTWTIDIDSNGIATIESTTGSYGALQYNIGSPRFLNYTSGQGPISLYHKPSAHVQVDVDGVSLNKQSITLAPSESETLTATVSPANASNKSVTWESLDSNVATVDSTGHVTAVAEGNTTIVVKTVDGGFAATCDVTVKNKEVTSLSVDPSTYTLKLGETFVLHAITNEDATIQTVTWSSENEAIVKVDSDGTIYGISEGGPVNVTATANNGKTASCAVTVSAATSGGGGGGGGDVESHTATFTFTDRNANFDETDSKILGSWSTNGTQGFETGERGIQWSTSNNPALTFSFNTNAPELTISKIIIVASANKTDKGITLFDGSSKIEEKTISSGTSKEEFAFEGLSLSNNSNINFSTTIPSGSKQGSVYIKSVTFIYETGGSGGSGGGDTPPTPQVVLSSIAVTGQKTSFTVGDTFSFGGTVTATYSNFDTADVTSSATFSGYNMSSASSQTVQVSYTENGVTQTTTYSITVNPRPATLLSISVSGQKTEFTVGDSFVFGGIVTANFDDGTTENVTENAGFSGYSLASAGTSTVIVTYNGKTTTYSINVKSSQGDVPSGDEYQITFTADSDSSTACTTATLRDIISSGSANISSVASVEKVYPGEKGAKFGSSKGGGSLSLNLSSSISENETVYIKMDVAQYGTEAGSISISVNGETSARLTVDASSSTSGMCAFSPTLLVSSIKITSVKRVYLKGITISTKPLEPVNPTSITVSPSSLEMTKGDTSSLSVSYLPTNANQNKEITWTSSNTNVAVVSSDGTVTAKANGNTTITATTKLGLTSTCNVVVKDIAVTSISVNPTSATISNGSSKQITATINPSNATNKGVTWTSSNSTIASVDSNGLVTGKSVGKATITATALGDTSKKATCAVEVVTPQSDAWTIMIYMCGADLESESALASGDIAEMLAVSGQSDKTNVIIQTGGASKWGDKTNNFGISGESNQRYHIENRRLICDNAEVYKNTYKSMGQSSTFADFITWGLTEYPAEKTGVILWNHGGAMRGVCYDELSGDDSLLNSEVQSAMSTAFSNVGRSTSNKLEWIGYDACLMQAQDIAEFNSQYFNYMIASQESEAGYGWDYDKWLGYIYSYNTYSTEQVLTKICDTFISDNGGVSSRNGDQTLSWLNLSYMPAYKTAWESFAAALKTKFGNKVSKNDFYLFMHNNVKYFGGESDDDEYFGMFDVIDFLNKIEANTDYNPGGNYISNVKAAFNNLLGYSTVQKGAGNANGLCCIYSKTSGNWLLGTKYSTTQTNFTNWRSFVSTYGAL